MHKEKHMNVQTDKTLINAVKKLIEAKVSMENDIMPIEIITITIDTLSELGILKVESSEKANLPNLKPAVSIEESVQDDFIICLEDGKRFKMMKRHLRETYGMSPDQYRNKWGLPSDYPMTAPGYSKYKARYAKSNGLGKYEREIRTLA